MTKGAAAISAGIDRKVTGSGYQNHHENVPSEIEFTVLVLPGSADVK